jgi:hypothetical protein
MTRHNIFRLDDNDDYSYFFFVFLFSVDDFKIG